MIIKFQLMRIFLVFLLIVNAFFVSAQTVSQQLANAMAQLEKEEQFKHTTLSLYVVETKWGWPLLPRKRSLPV